MLNSLAPIIGFVLALLITRQSIPSLVNISNKKHLFDVPNSRSSTKSPVPTLGGLSIFIGFIISIILNPVSNGLSILPFFIASLFILLFAGLKDDLLIISARAKFCAQIISALILIFCADVRFTNLHGFLGIYEISILVGVPLTIFVMVVFTNSFNLIDGIDGLASGLAIFVSLILGVWFFLVGQTGYSVVCFALVGALVSFFYCNVFGCKNKLFMGDTGSLLIGMVVSVLIIQFNELSIGMEGPFAIHSAPAVSFGLVIYPLFDTMRVFFIRLIQKKSPFTADRNHIHHRLLSLGYSHKRATCTIILVNALFVVPLYFIQSLGIIPIMVYNIGIAFLFCCFPAIKLQNNNVLKSDDPHQQILYPRKRDAQKLALDTLKVQSVNKAALIRALEQMNIF